MPKKGAKLKQSHRFLTQYDTNLEILNEKIRRGKNDESSFQHVLNRVGNISVEMKPKDEEEKE